MADYQVLVVNMGGVPYSEIANAKVESITWELNGWGEATLSMSVTDPQATSEFAPNFQTREEVQIWRNGALIWWGIYVAATADRDSLRITCYGLLWYFSRRYFGPIHSSAMPQLLVNGTFENATVLTGWGASGTITASSSTSRRRSGARALKMVTAGVNGDNPYIAQGVAVPTPARVRPLTYTVSGWHYRESLTIPDPSKRGLVIFPATSGGAPLDPIISALAGDDEPLGEWFYREAQLTLPAGFTGYVGVALLAPAAGTVYWDDVRLAYEQRTGAIEGEDWASDYLQRIFSYGAGISGGGTGGSPVCWGAPVNKSTLNMTWTGVGSAVGALRADLFWDHADEANIFAAMADLAARNVLDFEVTWPTNGRSRTLTAWAPRKGTTKAGLAAEDGRNVVEFRYDVDGRRLANDVRVVGRSPGKLKEEGQGGGPTVATQPQLESVVSPAFELSGQQLADMAASEVARLAEPVRTPTIKVQAGMYMGDGAEAGAPLTVGDTIPVRISHGWVQEVANRRVVKMTLYPESETLDLVVNV